MEHNTKSRITPFYGPALSSQVGYLLSTRTFNGQKRFIKKTFLDRRPELLNSSLRVIVSGKENKKEEETISSIEKDIKFLAAKRSSTSALFSLSVRLSVRLSQIGNSHCLSHLWQLMTAYDNLIQLTTTDDSWWQLMTADNSIAHTHCTYTLHIGIANRHCT